MGKYTIENNNGSFTAVLYSPGYGAGWSTWGTSDLAFDHRLIKHLLPEALDLSTIMEWETIDVSATAITPEFNDLVNKYYPNTYMGGAKTLCIRFIPVGTVFRITQYDGAEKFETLNLDDYFTA